MNFGMALAPWLFGLLADGTTTQVAIGVGIGISFLAALINSPLVRYMLVQYIVADRSGC